MQELYVFPLQAKIIIGKHGGNNSSKSKTPGDVARSYNERLDTRNSGTQERDSAI